MELIRSLTIVCILLVSVGLTDLVFAQTSEPSASASVQLRSIKGVAKLLDDRGTLDTFAKISTERAELFRRSYIASEKLESRAKTLARLSIKFRDAFRSKKNVKDLPNLFAFSKKDILVCFHGQQDPIDAQPAFGPFAGRWHGTWDTFPVHHHWSPVLGSPIGLGINLNESNSIDIVAYQYAWIGDGYGLNLVTKTGDGAATRHFILGYVEHLDRNDGNRVTARRPHVGTMPANGQLIWITAGEVFFEEMILKPEPHYTIIGFNYRVDVEKLTTTRAFCTTYFREQKPTSLFRDLPIRVTENRRSEN